MPDVPLPERTLVEIRRLLAEGAISSREVVESCRSAFLEDSRHRTPVNGFVQFFDDAVELAFKNPGGGPAAPILILRGYPSGNFVSSDEAGALPKAVKKAAEGVQYAAKVMGKDRWTVEWRVPFVSLGIDPAKSPKFPFSLTVRKSAEPIWVLWAGTHHATWNVDNAGYLELK